MRGAIEPGGNHVLHYVHMQEQDSNRRRRTSPQTEKGYFKQTAGSNVVEREGTSISPSYRLTRAEFEAANWLDCVLTSKIRKKEIEASNPCFMNERRSELKEGEIKLEQFYSRRLQRPAKPKVASLAAD